MSELRRIHPSIRVSNKAKVAVLVQYIAVGDKPCYPEFALSPGEERVTMRPAGYLTAILRSTSPKIAQFLEIEHGFWADGLFIPNQVGVS